MLRLTELPEDLVRWRTLEILRVNNNRITVLPPAIEMMESLYEMDLSENSFTEFYFPKPIEVKRKSRDGKREGRTKYKFKNVSVCSR